MATVHVNSALSADEESRKMLVAAVSDKRGTSSARIVTPKSVDLRKANGYALGEGWVRWGQAAPLHPGQYLVLQGRDRRGSAVIVAITTEDDESSVDVTADLLTRAKEARVPDEYKAKALNSDPYAIALAIHHTGERPPQVVNGAAITSRTGADLSDLTDQLRQLSPADLLQVLSDLLQFGMSDEQLKALRQAAKQLA